MRCVVLLSVVLLAAPNVAAAQEPGQPDTTSSIPQYRSPSRARALSLIPGWGYMYTGEYFRGYTVWLTTIAGPPVGALFIGLPCGFEPDCSRPEKIILPAFGVLLIAGSLLDYVSSIRDAPKSAERANIRHARKMTISPVLTAPTSNGAWKAGVSLAW